ncbi:MAG: hypothetical protein ACREP0_10935, partial [Rhodanobacteraceae bacterium]
PTALAAAIERIGALLAEPGRVAELDAMARARIVDTYSLEALLRNSEEAFLALCNEARSA